jgi:hypothetical protein
LGLDALYAYAGGSKVRWRDPSGATLLCRIDEHRVDAGVTLGGFVPVGGGLTLGVRLGGRMVMTAIQPLDPAPMPSDRLSGMTALVVLDAPALGRPGGHAIGVSLYGGGMGGVRDENANLQDGRDRGTFGGLFGAALGVEVWRREHRGAVLLAASYGFDLTVSHFRGASTRDPSSDLGDLGSSEHRAMLGLSYGY